MRRPTAGPLEFHSPSAERLSVGAGVVTSGEGGGGGGSPGQVWLLSPSDPGEENVTKPGGSLWIWEPIQDW